MNLGVNAGLLDCLISSTSDVYGKGYVLSDGAFKRLVSSDLTYPEPPPVEGVYLHIESALAQQGLWLDGSS